MDNTPGVSAVNAGEIVGVEFTEHGCYRFESFVVADLFNPAAYFVAHRRNRVDTVGYGVDIHH